MKTIKCGFVFVFLLSGIFCLGQTKAFQDFYPSGELKAKGFLIEDTVKVGDWIYFKQNGKVLAKGKFVSGQKKGKWKYSNGNGEKYIVIFKKDYLNKEQLTIDNEGNLVIDDNCCNKLGFCEIYTNGRKKF